MKLLTRMGEPTQNSK